MAGWGANSALSLVGGYRFVAQGLAYELPWMFALICAATGAQSLNAADIVTAQQHHLWFAVWMPAAFAVYLASVYAFGFTGPFAYPAGRDLAAGAGSVRGGVMQLVAHAAVKSLLLLAAGAWLTALGTRQLPALRGAARRYRFVGVTFTIGAAVLAGLPPGSLWVTKDEVLAAALNFSPALYAVGLAAAVVSAVYSAKAAWYVWQPTPADAGEEHDTERRGTRRIAPVTRPPLAVLAVLAAVLGVLAVPPVAAALNQALGTAGDPSPAGWELAGSAVAAVAASGLAWWWGAWPAPARRPALGWLTAWLGLELAARVLTVSPVLRLARALGAFDDRILDRAVLQIARGGAGLARLAARADDSGIDRAVAGVAAAARSLGRLARRPQTGQVHAYYAQAAIALAVLALIFVLVR